MSDDNGLYYMRARYYSPAMKRFVNQDLLLGNITEGPTLNRFAFVTGRPVSLVDPFGLFGQDDATSLALDFVPVVGSCKGVSEFILGHDPITWEPIPRWVALLGIIPGGKYLTKAGKAGEAIVYLYKGVDRHFSILVKRGDKVVHTEQVIIDEAMSTTISKYLDNYGDEIRKQFEFALPDAVAAQKYQKKLLNKNTGKYDLDTNSCLSHACDVLREGGLEVPTNTGEASWKKEVYEWLLRNQIK